MIANGLRAGAGPAGGRLEAYYWAPWNRNFGDLLTPRLLRLRSPAVSMRYWQLLLLAVLALPLVACVVFFARFMLAALFAAAAIASDTAVADASLPSGVASNLTARSLSAAASSPNPSRSSTMASDAAAVACNVVVREEDDGQVSVVFMDPVAVLDLVQRPEVSELASEVRERLQRVQRQLGE